MAVALAAKTSVPYWQTRAPHTIALSRAVLPLAHFVIMQPKLFDFSKILKFKNVHQTKSEVRVMPECET